MPRQKHAPTVSPAHTPNGQHKPFSWISDEAKGFPLADFAALSIDVCNGIHTCLELVNAADLERDAQADGDEDAIPAINVADTSYLLRMASAASQLLAMEAERRIEWVNKYGPARMKAEKGVTHA